ncbi:LytTR family transcriptional regulator DNA-binding domain-containing protein [Gracilibacillus caseinilyticus]|uniref:LytTR family transcriptional regulator DNA-binding domain-containing protein n=1 Tax=Gracilibacillus caseinilyticus TaxID=2932256 RepID=A0ABY4EWN6_9BACI|nr:response regulator transcription factor [Gracilibacillus caseinilyticus]UOQ48694.1 LytTR family transcriptional regulator DNA-binding domain-containing protein [Gracilibacillus caseinilyticus]
MVYFKIDNDHSTSELLPSFSLTVEETSTTSLYCDADIQGELLNFLQKHNHIRVFDQKDGLYQRLTVEDNIAFFHKWFRCSVPLPEILVLFELHTCVKTPLHKCSVSEVRRVHFAKYFMSGSSPMIFREPIYHIDIRSINTFIKMLQKIKESHIPVIVLVSNMEHALLLGDVAYKLQNKGLQQIEVEDQDSDTSSIESESTSINLLKIPAKVDDKIILFDPPEIDYIESQDGKAVIFINETSYTMDSTLTKMEKKLELYGFYRCHRSYIVNLQKVREIITWSKNTYSLRIDNNVQSTIPLSRTKIQDIQEKFTL